MSTDPTHTAAFFRAEGTLLPRPTSVSVAWLAANAQGIGERIVRLGTLGLSLPLWPADRRTARKLSWSALRGMSQDRLTVLGEEYFHLRLKDSLRPVGLDLLAQAKKQRRRTVLVSDSLDVIIAPLAAHLKVDDWIANRMELRNNRATGRLIDPIIGSFSGTELRSYADEHGLQLRQSSGYGASAEDAVLLSAVGLPCAVAPDRALRAMAHNHQWPVVNA